jgi:hypothetical protein
MQGMQGIKKKLIVRGLAQTHGPFGINADRPSRLLGFRLLRHQPLFSFLLITFSRSVCELLFLPERQLAHPAVSGRVFC